MEALMRGKIFEINVARGMVAVHTEAGDYSVFEVFGDEMEIGDWVTWNGVSPLGHEILRNLTQGQDLQVYFQNHHVSKGNLRQQLLF
jgi:hypothetical protein